jgi:hypothetical protein
MDARIWTFGATLFSLMYLTLGFYLDYTAIVVLLLLAAWVLALEVEREDAAKYVEMELRPALAFLGIFAVTVVALGPWRPPLFGPTLMSVQYADPSGVFQHHLIWFFFPFVPFVTGMAWVFYESAHPTAGIVFRTQNKPEVPEPPRVHVHLHEARRGTSRRHRVPRRPSPTKWSIARKEEDDGEEEDEDVEEDEDWEASDPPAEGDDEETEAEDLPEVRPSRSRAAPPNDEEGPSHRGLRHRDLSTL